MEDLNPGSPVPRPAPIKPITQRGSESLDLIRANMMCFSNSCGIRPFLFIYSLPLKRFQLEKLYFVLGFDPIISHLAGETTVPSKAGYKRLAINKLGASSGLIDPRKSLNRLSRGGEAAGTSSFSRRHRMIGFGHMCWFIHWMKFCSIAGPTSMVFVRWRFPPPTPSLSSNHLGLGCFCFTEQLSHLAGRKRTAPALQLTLGNH